MDVDIDSSWSDFHSKLYLCVIFSTIKTNKYKHFREMLLLNLTLVLEFTNYFFLASTASVEINMTWVKKCILDYWSTLVGMSGWVREAGLWGLYPVPPPFTMGAVPMLYCPAAMNWAALL